MSKVIVPWDLITNFVTDAFIGYGIPAEDAKICTDVLLESDRRGLKATAATGLSPFTWIGQSRDSKSGDPV